MSAIRGSQVEDRPVRARGQLTMEERMEERLLPPARPCSCSTFLRHSDMAPMSWRVSSQAMSRRSGASVMIRAKLSPVVWCRS